MQNSQPGLTNRGTISQNQPNQPQTKPRCIAFAISSFAFQIVMIFIYSFLVRSPTSFLNITSVIIAISMAILCCIGFGLYFSGLRKMIWSGMGISLFIMSVSLQLYPLANAFFYKSGIINANKDDSFDNKNYDLYLSNAESREMAGNTVTNAMRCSISIFVAFSSIMGRVGRLQLFVVALLGTIGYELNRQIAINIGSDLFGTGFIFGFGGWMGLAMAVTLKIRQAKQGIDTLTPRYLFNEASVHLYLFGNLIVLVLLPTLAADPLAIDQLNSFTFYLPILSVFLSMVSSLGTTLALSVFISTNGKIKLKDIGLGIMAGGVVGGSAAQFAPEPVLAVACGVVAGVIQVVLQYILERKLFQKFGIISTHSLTLFSIQPLIGSSFTSIYANRVVRGLSETFIYQTSRISSASHFISTLVCCGIGLSFGVLCGLILYCMANYKRFNMFSDTSLWVFSDSIRYPIAYPQLQVQQEDQLTQSQMSIQFMDFD